MRHASSAARSVFPTSSLAATNPPTLNLVTAATQVGIRACVRMSGSVAGLRVRYRGWWIDAHEAATTTSAGRTRGPSTRAVLGRHFAACPTDYRPNVSGGLDELTIYAEIDAPTGGRGSAGRLKRSLS